MYNRTTVRPTVQGATFSMRGQLYHGHYLIISPLHGHGEVANENPLILPRTLSIVGALVLLKRRAGKKMRAPLLGLPKSIYYFFSYRDQNDRNETKLTCNRGFRWIADSTSNDSIRRPSIPGEKSGLKYPKPLQSLLSMNQVSILKDKILIKM